MDYTNLGKQLGGYVIILILFVGGIIAGIRSYKKRKNKNNLNN